MDIFRLELFCCNLERGLQWMLYVIVSHFGLKKRERKKRKKLHVLFTVLPVRVTIYRNVGYFLYVIALNK